MIKKVDSLLVLSPHPDDAEVGAGGLISQLSKQVTSKFWIAFSKCSNSLPPESYDVMRFEMANSLLNLGFGIDEFAIHSYPVRNFPFHRQSILQMLYDVSKSFNPDLVLLPSTFDRHQDHQVIRQEGERAFHQSTIFGYEIPRNCQEFVPQLYFPITENQLNKKVESFLCYKSQNHRPYGDGQFIRSTAAYRGSQVDCDYAEAYEIVRMFWRTND